MVFIVLYNYYRQAHKYYIFKNKYEKSAVFAKERRKCRSRESQTISMMCRFHPFFQYHMWLGQIETALLNKNN